MLDSPTGKNLDAIDHARRVTAAEQYDIGKRFKIVIDSSDGSWMRDVEGNRVLDVTAASGALLLGNQHPQVVAAVVDCVRQHGVLFTTTLSPMRIELADRLCQWYPAGEKAVFCKTGSEATTTAMRLARAATGRTLVLTAGYHGWHDWQLMRQAPGFDQRHNVVSFGDNEFILQRLLAEFADDVACVFVTPDPVWFDAEHYQRLSELCRRHGVLFALDEVRTGLRWGAHGLNGTAGVPADLITISKGLGNGHSIASVLGRAELINAYDRARISGTYTREIVPMAAALAVLEVIADGTEHERTEEIGRQLSAGMSEILAAAGVPAYIAGPPMMFDVVLGSTEFAREVFRAAFEYGVYFDSTGTQMITTSWTAAELDHTLTAFDKGLAKVLARGGYEPGPVTTEHKVAAASAAGVELAEDTALLTRLDETVRAISRRDRDH